MLFSLPFTSNPLLAMVAMLMGIGGMFWMFATLFELEFAELAITFVCAIGLQGILLGVLHVVIHWIVPLL